MITEDSDLNHASDNIDDWLHNPASFISSLLDYPYNSSEIGAYSWWNQPEEASQYLSTTIPDGVNHSTCNTSADTNTASLNPPRTPTVSSNSKPSDNPKKRRISDDQVPKSSERNHQRKNPMSKDEVDSKQVVIEEPVITPVRRSSGNKKGNSKVGGNNGNSNSKDGRWAEQLLIPCATAITAGNGSRVQHLLYVLRELALPTGDANHRLAYHGLRALGHHIASLTNNSSSFASAAPITFASTEPKFFQRTLFKFNEVSPWFAFSNNIANASIIQILTQEQAQKRELHIIDIGVSHGMQWPTLLEALTRLPGGPPPVVRITVIPATTQNDQNSETPFSVGPSGDDFSARLLTFAKSMNIELQINVLAGHSLQNLSAEIINTNPDEVLIVCAQFRLHCLNHTTLDERTEFLRSLKNLDPKGVILSENNMDCSCNNCADFATGFARRVDYLWRFLDSTSSAFKGRESDERRVMEGEAAKALMSNGETNEGKESWYERMRGVGFVEEVFGEDAIDGARAFLRKYDSNWEMRMDDKDGCLGLQWKGQPVSFCSLWKLDAESK